jgi:hypothetical protein
MTCDQSAGLVKLRPIASISVLRIARQQLIAVERVKDANAVAPEGCRKASAFCRIGQVVYDILQIPKAPLQRARRAIEQEYMVVIRRFPPSSHRPR